jgi:hypothetical protein
VTYSNIGKVLCLGVVRFRCGEKICHIDYSTPSTWWNTDPAQEVFRAYLRVHQCIACGETHDVPLEDVSGAFV